MDSLEHNWADNSETICPTVLVSGKQDTWMLFFQITQTNQIV